MASIYTDYQYVIDSTGLKQRYDRICQIIELLELKQIAVIGNSDVEQYSINDGQVTITTRYRSPEQLQKAIIAYERIKNYVLQQLTGTRVSRLADAQSVQANGIVRRY